MADTTKIMLLWYNADNILYRVRHYESLWPCERFVNWVGEVDSSTTREIMGICQKDGVWPDGMIAEDRTVIFDRNKSHKAGTKVSPKQWQFYNDMALKAVLTS